MIVIRFYQLGRCTAREGNVSFGGSTTYIALLSTSVGTVMGWLMFFFRIANSMVPNSMCFSCFNE